MTRNNLLNKTKTRLMLTLLTICMICMSLFCFTACSSDKDSSSNKPNYSYTEENSSIISNSSFSYGTANMKITAFPKSSVTGWTKSVEYNMASTSAKYGVIDVSDEGWSDLVNDLYNDSYFLNFYKVKYGFEIDDVKTAIKEEKGNSYTPTSDDIQNYIVKEYINSNKTFVYPENTTAINQFKNPGKHEGATDNKLYMLNNYLSKDNVGRGTAQKVTSSSKITLNKGEYGKVSVWVKTQNLSGLTNDFGANIRLTNNFDTSAQADFGIYNIVDTEWTKYTLYIKADDTFATSFTLVLGLGSDRFSATEGTAYFDDVEFEHLTAEEYASETGSLSVKTSNFIFNSKDKVAVDAIDLKSGSSVSPVLYDMSFNKYLKNNAPEYKKSVELNSSNLSVNYTTSNKVDANGNAISGGRFDDVYNSPEVELNNGLDANKYPYVSKSIKATLAKSSYTLSLFKNNPISVAPESYAYVEFYVKNELSKFGSTSITVDLFDIYGNTVKKRPAIATISEANEEWQKVGLMVKNNFEEGVRSFYIDVVLGPTDVVSTDYAVDYATGIVTLTQPTLSSGSTNQYINADQTEKTENYDLYSLYNTTANGSSALYAGSASDYTEEDDKTETYSLNVAPSDVGTIESRPATPAGYKGIVANHFYITRDDNAETAINTNPTAGLINTKYLSNYNKSTYGDIGAKLNGTYEDDIQPLMIYNKTQSQYGYIGNSQTISASSYAKFEVTLRVVDSAKAFIYLVNTDGDVKEVLTFDDFTVNADVLGNSISDGASIKGADKKLFLEVTSDMMKEDGWLTVEFYIATGASAKNVRVEVWNGARDESNPSKGHIFIKDIHSHLSTAFTEASNSKNAWTESGNPLYAKKTAFDDANVFIYKRTLTDIEKQFNAEQTDSSKIISYSAKYVWANNSTMIYAIYNSIDPVDVDPYANVENEEENEAGSGCTTQTDPATFWLSFSSIVLAVVLVGAIIVLFTKNIRRRKKANASDAKSHFTVTSRIKSKNTQSSKQDASDVDEQIIIEDSDEDTQEESQEQTLDEYVYGEVQEFTTLDDEQTQSDESEEQTDK